MWSNQKLISLDNSIVLLALCDRSFNRQHAFGLLRAIKEAFGAEYDPGIVGASVRPYAFMRFEPRMQEIRRAFNEGRQRGNLDRLRDELIDVTKIMTTSINEVLERGDRLDKTSLISRELSDESKRYLEETRELNLAYMWRTYGPLCFMTFCVFILWVFYHYVL